MSLALTASGISLGYALATYMTGFTPNNTNIGPFSVIFPAGGGCMLCDVTVGSGHLRTSASTADNQLFSSLTNRQTVAEIATGLASLNGHYYWSRNVLDDLVEVSAAGAIVQTIIADFGAGVRGIWPDTLHGCLYVAIDGGFIVKVDPIAKTATNLVAITSPDGLVVSTDCSTVYVREGLYVRGYRTSDGAKVFDMSTNGQGSLPSPDGIGFYGSVLIVNDNGGSVYQVPLDGSQVTQIASGGSRGDFVSLHPDGSLILSQSDSFMRLIVPLNPPTNVISSLSPCGSIALTWTPGIGADSFVIYRSDSPRNPLTVQKELNPYATGTGTTYTDNAPPIGTQVWYYIQSKSSATGAVGTTTAGIGPLQALPLAPTSVSVSAACAQINISWDPMTCALSYNVRRRLPSGELDAPVNVPLNGYADTNIVFGQTYGYQITSVGLRGETPLNPSLVFWGASRLPGQVMGLVATAGDDNVTLAWTLVPGNGVTYTILRGASPGEESVIATGVTGLTFIDTTMPNNAPSYYQVMAVSSCGNGMVSAEVYAIPECCLGEWTAGSNPSTVWTSPKC